MEKTKKKLSTLSIILLVIAIGMLLFGGIGGTRAALTESDRHVSDLEMKQIDVTLNENGSPVEGALLGDLLGDEPLKIGADYDEEITVTNPEGGIDEYVRAVVYKYWTTDTGKHTDLSPELIRVKFGEKWKIDKDLTTEERTVLYYDGILEAGAESEPLVTAIGIDDSLATLMVENEPVKNADGTTTISYTYKYDGIEFGLKVEADAVQTHNAKDAIRSAWGIEVTGDDESIKF